MGIVWVCFRVKTKWYILFRVVREEENGAFRLLDNLPLHWTKW